MMHLRILFIFSLCLFKMECVNYCDIDTCSSKADHVRCLNSEFKLVDGCKLEDIGKYKALILATHNSDRDEIACGRGGQPPAADMKKLIWDTELEKVAEYNVMSCKMEHDKCRDVPRFSCGQNLLTASDRDLALKQMNDGWYKEKESITGDAAVNSFGGGGGAGHYTQMVWANCQYIGCAMTSDSKMYYMACNYGPGGNMIGDPIYKIGKAASACPKGFTPDTFYKGLCNGVSPSSSPIWLLRAFSIYWSLKTKILKIHS